MKIFGFDRPASLIHIGIGKDTKDTGNKVISVKVFGITIFKISYFPMPY